MANFNKVILAGNLTRDPELRYTPKGTAVAEFGVAVNRNWRTESGENREEILFVDIVAYARTAEVIGQYFKKGRPILIDGRLKLDTWEDKQSGQKRSKHRVVLEGFQFIDGGRGDASSGDSPRSRPAAPAAGASPAAAESDGPPPEDDDVPF
jgi:single-strand DNA-binding protein